MSQQNNLPYLTIVTTAVKEDTHSLASLHIFLE